MYPAFDPHPSPLKPNPPPPPPGARPPPTNTTVYPAHEEHQLYLEKNPGGYCNHSIRFVWEDQPQ